MGTPQKIWHTGLKGTLWSEANGLGLSIQRSAVMGYFRFMVLSDLANAATPPRILASGNERSALRAMAAAEAAAADVLGWPAETRNAGSAAIGAVSAPPALAVTAPRHPLAFAARSPLVSL